MVRVDFVGAEHFVDERDGFYEDASKSPLSSREVVQAELLPCTPPFSHEQISSADA